MEGGATRAAAVATWALVRARGDVLVGVAALRSHAARCAFLFGRVGWHVGWRYIAVHPWNCWLRKHGACDPFVIIVILFYV